MLNREQLKDYAKAIISDWNEGYEYSLVYEAADDLGEEEWDAIFNLMNEATITVSWDDE